MFTPPVRTTSRIRFYFGFARFASLPINAIGGILSLLSSLPLIGTDRRESTGSAE